MIQSFKDDYYGCLKDARVWESAVQKLIESMGWQIFRNDVKDCTQLDFGLNLFFDLKYRGVPFRKAKQYVNLESYEAIPLDVNKMNRYAKHPGGILVMVVDYTPETETQGIYIISVKKVLLLMEKYGESRIHYYKDRHDDAKNSKSSFYVSIHECMKLPDIFFKQLGKFLPSQVTIS